jgi:hypothetical protein
LTLDGNFSVSIWFKSTDSGNESIISDWGSGTRAFQMRLSSSKIQVFTSENGITSSHFITSPLSYNTGDWYNAVFTWGPTGNGILYVNGVNVVSSAYSYYQIYQSSNNLMIGNNQFGGQNFDGRLDDIQVYDFELNATQVSDIYNSGYVTAPTASPIHHWKLGEEDTFSTNWTVKDSIGSLDGTSVNMEEVDRKMGVAYSMEFDGVDEYIDFGNILDLNGLNPFTISLWGKFSASDTILKKEDGSNVGYRLTIDGNSKINFSIGDGSSNRIRIRQSVGGGWTTEISHLTLTYDGSGLASGFTLYKNSVSESFSTLLDSLSNSSNAGDFYLGNSSAFAGLEGSNFLDGNLMYISVFDSELSASDVALLYNTTGTNNGVPIDPRDVGLNPTFFAPLGGQNDTFSTDWTITDEISGNNGTSVNMEEADKTSETP